MGRKKKQIIDGKLTCSKCRENLPTSEFSKQKEQSTGFCSYCKSCGVFRHYAQRYGINREDAQLLAEKQDNSCAICEEKTNLVMDHCHASKNVRGFLCQACNVGLGYFKDKSKLLRQAAEYLERQSCTKK